jgi:hypothetical protein
MDCGLPRGLSRGKVEADRKNDRRQGTFPEHVNSSAKRAPGLAARRNAQKLCYHCVAQFDGAASAQNLRRKAKADSPGLDLRISTFVILVETLGELLTFVVNSHLPIERLKQSIRSLSRALGIRLAAADWSSVDLS